MRWLRVSFGLLCLLPLSSLAGFPSAYGASGYNDAIRLAKQDGKPIMVFYTMAACTVCTVVKGFLDTTESRAALLGNYHFADVNVRAVPTQLQSEMAANGNFGFGGTRVSGIPVGAPQMVILNADGKLICSIPRGVNNSAHAVKVHELIKRVGTAPRERDAPIQCLTS